MEITLYTDPACPFAFSAEPNRWRLRWHCEPLATAEIHTIMGGDPAKLRAALALVAKPIPSGADCFWRL